MVSSIRQFNLESIQLTCLQAQTPAQRRANEKHARGVEKRMGKPEAAYKKKDARRSPVSLVVVGESIHAGRDF
jgi:hypothetical protein